MMIGNTPREKMNPFLDAGLKPAFPARSEHPRLSFVPTRNVLHSERLLVFLSLRKVLVRTNSCAIIARPGVKCGLARISY